MSNRALTAAGKLQAERDRLCELLRVEHDVRRGAGFKCTESDCPYNGQVVGPRQCLCASEKLVAHNQAIKEALE